jgi:hypothetical protein
MRTSVAPPDLSCILLIEILKAEPLRPLLLASLSAVEEAAEALLSNSLSEGLSMRLNSELSLLRGLAS